MQRYADDKTRRQSQDFNCPTDVLNPALAFRAVEKQVARKTALAAESIASFFVGGVSDVAGLSLTRGAVSAFLVVPI